MLRFLCRNVAADGALDLEEVRPHGAPAPATGEAVADFLGLDVFGLAPS